VSFVKYDSVKEADEEDLHAVFAGSTEYAHLAGRAQPNAFDVLRAREQVEISSVRRLRREAKRRRPGMFHDLGEKRG